MNVNNGADLLGFEMILQRPVLNAGCTAGDALQLLYFLQHISSNVTD
jgi:hypothetical protein